MRIKRDEEEAAVNMTPMIDCVFQLLIFFMLVADMANLATDREISLPYADQTKPADIPDPIVINVRKDGSTWIGEEQVSDVRLSQILRNEADRVRGAGGISEKEVLIRGDQLSRWENVQKVMWYAQDAAIYRIKIGSSEGKEKPKG
ncbi:MAG: biopolymer transporter ExbD [Planctomycetota bacterium]